MMIATRTGRRWVGAVLGALAVGCAGCSGTCPDGDIDCLMESLVIYGLGSSGSSHLGSTSHLSFQPSFERMEEGPLEVVWIETSSLPEPSSTSPEAPQITNDVPPMGFSSTTSVSVMQLDYADPVCQCQPMFCTRTHVLYFRSPCTPMKRDGYVVGRTYLGYRWEAVPESTTEQLEVEVVPICDPDCSDVTEAAEAGDGSFDDPVVLSTEQSAELVAGPAESTTFTIVSDEEASESAGAQCSDQEPYCGSCGTVAACVRYDGGSCVAAWYETGDGRRFSCDDNCDCSGAANEMPYACGCV